MGVFDDIRCKYPLPIAGANALDYQTKDTPAQFCDRYEIREDGTLWHEAYDIEDQSEAGKWLREHPGQSLPEDKGFLSFAGCLARINKRWEQVLFTGEIRFYTVLNPDNQGWIEWSSYFVGGKLSQIHLIEHRGRVSA